VKSIIRMPPEVINVRQAAVPVASVGIAKPKLVKSNPSEYLLPSVFPNIEDVDLEPSSAVTLLGFDQALSFVTRGVSSWMEMSYYTSR